MIRFSFRAHACLTQTLPRTHAHDAMMAAATAYIPAAKKALVLASTPGMVGGGEAADVTFKAPAAAGAYTYLCSFPGHFGAGMKGVLTVK